MFENVRLLKFKQFRDQTIPLVTEGVSFIAGGNNAGKSTVLHGLAIWEFCRAVIEAEKGPGALLAGSRHKGLGLGVGEFSPINVPTLKHLWTNLSPCKTPEDLDGFTLRIGCTWKESGIQRELEFGLALANDRLFIKATNSNLNSGDKIPRVAYLPPFAGIIDHEARVPVAIRRRRIGEGLAGAVLRNILLDLHKKNLQKRAELKGDKTKIKDADLKELRNTDPWELLQYTLRNTFSTELVVAPFKEEYHSHIRIEVVKGDSKGYQFSRYPSFKSRDLMVEGSGFLQWLSVYALATDPEVDVLLLDEPDAHLHCSLQLDLMQHLIQLAEKTGKQVLVATHSTEILRQYPPEQILEVSTNKSPRYLSEEHQKVGLMAGLGTEYAPRVDAAKRKKHILFVEGDSDFKILHRFSERLAKTWPDSWVEWVNKSGHKERKHIFQALQEEIRELVAFSICDRDDMSINIIGEDLADKSCSGGSPNFHSKRWLRRNIESYLLWPAAISKVANMTLEDVEKLLRDDYGVAIGDTFPQTDAPAALLDIDGKKVLKSLGVSPMDVVEEIPSDKIPNDIITIVNNLISLG